MARARYDAGADFYAGGWVSADDDVALALLGLSPRCAARSGPITGCCRRT